MTKSKFLKRYEKNKPEVKEYMGYIADALIEKYGDITDTFIISLDLLAHNLEIMKKATEDMDEKGITDDDRYHGKKKSAPLQTFFQAQGYVNNILNSFGMHPMSASKIKKNKEEVNVDAFLDALTA